jgi:hypothetical protein
MVNVYPKYARKKRLNKLPHDTCPVVVHRTQVVQAILGAIQEYAAFEMPELD